MTARTGSGHARSSSTPATSEARLGEWLGTQRWYAADHGEPAVTGVRRIELAGAPDLTIVLVDTDGGDRYQLVQADGAPDRADQPGVATELGRWVAGGATATAPAPAPTSPAPTSPADVGPGGDRIEARWIGEPPGDALARPLGAEQSNTSVVIGGTHVLKVLRRVRPGAHPEVEVGRHLAAVAAGPDHPHVPVPALAGWYQLVPAGGGEPTVLGLVHELIPGALDGWQLILSALAADPGGSLDRLRALGVAVAELHAALAAPGEGFGTVPIEPEDVRALATEEALEPLAVRIGTDGGAAIRTHGDLHLGQTLLGPDGWAILDFEGEPLRSLEERRRRQSPLRDVAGMLRSLAYAAAAHERASGRRLSPGWEPAARAALLDGYLTTIPPALVPTSAAATHALLTLYEVEKATYEIAYERAHRPDWLAIPAAGLARLIERIAR